ncbi:MAG: ATP-binding protein [Dysgonamonadaceae bacterium]|jgi:hypothetical protein|nr:ATP-binding protein [Dysgonamonadaceae bacterium]
MTTKVRDMPVGIQDFGKLRRGGYLYVDKTDYVYEMARLGRPYFLGRPRRFGKSLFLTTLKAYFLGKKELFEGLYIYGVEKDWLEYPVFHFEFVGEEYTSLKHFQAALDDNLTGLEAVWGKDKVENTYARRFKGLIRRAHEKTGLGVVVLVDEYDKPLLETFNNPELNDTVRNMLKGFYGVLKGMDASLRFVFLTGVTKFAKVSVFSDLNMLVDISMDREYAGICGISEKELLANFQPEIHALAEDNKLTDDEAVAQLKKYYDGYHFAKESEDIYNPYSVLNTFYKKEFAYYWFQTGTPTFLVKMLQNIDFNLPRFENDIHVPVNYITDYRADAADPVPVLYQSGYLTIKKYDSVTGLYTLGFPNEEVKYGFLNELLPVYSGKTLNDSSISVISMMQALKKGDVGGMMTMLQAFCASIPYDLPRKKQRDESYFQSLFYLIFSLMGQFVQTEVKSAVGRADAVVKTAGAIYVFEFKMDDTATAKQALEQIEAKSYLIPYQAEGREIVKIGAAFNRKKGLLTGWETGKNNFCN